MAAAEDLAGAAPAQGELKPPWIVKVLYSFGSSVEASYLAVAGFIFFYYTVVLGLSGALVGVALAISMAVDAVVDPLVGSISDNLRSRFGRRLPLMMLGAPLMGVSLYLLFAPPQGLEAVVLCGWLTVSKLALRGFASVFNLPFFTLGAGMADGYVERSSVVAYRTVAGIVVQFAVNGAAYSALFFGAAGGLQRADAYPAFGVAVGVFAAVGGLIGCLGVWRYAASLPQPKTRPRPVFVALGPEVTEVFRNRSFRVLFFSALIAYVAAGLNAAFNNHAYVFVWHIPPSDIRNITFVYLGGITLGVPLTPPLLRLVEKRTAVLIGLGIILFAWILIPGLWLAGLFTVTGSAATPYLAATLGLAGIGIGFIAIAYPSMMADAADEHEVRFGARREGLYFSGLGFASKAATGLGQLVAGFALEAMALPTTVGKMAGATLPEAMQAKIMLTWGPLSAAIGLAAFLLLMPYSISRSRHDDISARLKAKRVVDVAEGRSS